MDSFDADHNNGVNSNRQVEEIEMAKNVEMRMEDNILIVEIDMTMEYGRSKSGKTIVIASTEGNTNTPDGDAKIGINVYKYPK